VFADESGFLLIPHVAKTWSPQGCTPVHYHREGRRDKVSVISGISVSPQRQRLGLYYHLYSDNIGQEEVCTFLRGCCAFSARINQEGRPRRNQDACLSRRRSRVRVSSLTSGRGL
jgi:hypothetical protein